MSGPSANQQSLGEEQLQFYKEGVSEAGTTFSEDQGLLKLMQSVYDPILAKGPNQEGFSAPELSDLNATAKEGTAENYEGAARAVNEQIAGEGGGPLPSGSNQQLKEEVAESSARQESAEESQIKQADYNQGYDEFKQATSALATASGELSPANYETAATGAGSAAESTQAAITQENNSWETAALGAAGAIGSSVVDENPSGIFN